MVSRWRRAAAPSYLFLCLILGGSAQGVLANMVLQLLGVGLIAWAAIAPSQDVRPGGERQLYGLILLLLTVAALQLVPVPPSIWSHLGGRSVLAAGYGLLGLPAPWLPISVAPYDSLAALYAIVPPLALLTVVLRIGARPLWLVAALLAGLFAGILLGLLQVSSLGAHPSPWYLYAETNVGTATGFFANSNHMATLLLVSIPFLAALVALVTGPNAPRQRIVGVATMGGASAVFVLFAIVLNGSLAGYCLAAPVVLTSALLLLRPRSRLGPWLAIGGGLVFAIALGALLLSPINSTSMHEDASRSLVSRSQMLSKTVVATREFMPFGSGLGTFPRIYALHESDQSLDPLTWVNHAHDDYAEAALEMGLPGVMLLILFLLWWGRAVARAWRDGSAGPFARAAAIASATILIHSIVDFPLRTAAISSCFAMCMALLIRWQSDVRPTEQHELRPTRHLVID